MFRKARFSKRVGFQKFIFKNSQISMQKFQRFPISMLLVPKNQPMNLLFCVNVYILFQNCDILCGFCLHSLEQGLG